MNAASAVRAPRSAPEAAGAAPGVRRLAAWLLLGQFAAMWSAFFVLAPAIDWPASLDLPAAQMLPLLIDEYAAVFTGYASYLVHALLLVPLAIALRHTLHMGPVAGGLAMALGVLAGFAKALGIVRWLFLMPALATAWVDPGTTETTRDVIAVAFDAFNAYAGGVGEVLGVGLFAGLWTVTLSVALTRLGGAARAIGYAGFVAAALLFATLPSVVGVESPLLLTASSILWQLWTAALAVWHLRATASR